MNKYEVLYILDAEIAEETKNQLIERFESLVKENGGEVEKTERWGLRKYTYPINFKREGYYVLMNFSSESSFPLEMERQMRITDGIVRHMIVKK